MKIKIILAVAVLAGCTSTSGILKSGPDTFTVVATASPGAGGATTAKKSVYDQANAECTKIGASVEIVTEHATAPSWTDGMYTIDLAFKCRKAV